MKKLMLSIIVSFTCIQAYSQSVKPFHLNDFIGKRITSILKISEKGTDSPDTKGREISGADRIYTRQADIKNNKKSSANILVERSLKRYQVFSDFKSNKVLYDSDNKFDRTGAMNTVYGSFDAMIGEIVECNFNDKGLFLDTLINLKGNAYQIESFFVGNSEVYKNYLNPQWSTIFQSSLPEKDFKVGDKFKDYRIKKNNDFLNDYEIKELENKKTTLSIKGQRLPKNFMMYPKGLDTMQRLYMIYNGKFIYDGTIVFNSDTKLIEKLNLEVKIYSVGTPTEELLMTKQVEVINTIEKLK